LSSSRRLAASSGVSLDSPVTFPPGRARLLTMPVSTRSSLQVATTIGIVCVALRAASSGAPHTPTRRTSTGNRTNSVARSANRSGRPPSIEPRSRHCVLRRSRDRATHPRTLAQRKTFRRCGQLLLHSRFFERVPPAAPRLSVTRNILRGFQLRWRAIVLASKTARYGVRAQYIGRYTLACRNDKLNRLVPVFGL